MSAKIKQLIKLLETKDLEADVEFVVVETKGEGNLVCMDIGANAHQMAELMSMFAQPHDERARHWSDVLDVQLDANQDKVEKKYNQKREQYRPGTPNGNRTKFEAVQKAWDEYNGER